MTSSESTTTSITEPSTEDHPLDTDPNWLPRWEIIFLATIDILICIIFVVIGRASHELRATQGPVRAVINSAMPFAIGWIIAGAGTGYYRGSSLFPLPRVIFRVLITGILGGPIGIALRAVFLGRPIIWSFFFVGSGILTGMMLLWRVVWSRVRLLWWPELI